MTPEIHGIMPVMITPFTEDNAIDYAGLERLIEWYLSHGADALFAVCQSSEMGFLSLQEREALGRFVVKQVAGRVPVVVSGHISDDPHGQMEDLKAAVRTGADAVVLVTNHLDPQQQGREAFLGNLKWLMERLPQEIPLGLYECPVPYRRLIDDLELKWCRDSGRFVLLKDVSCDLATIRRRIEWLEGSPLTIINANATIAWEAMQAGSRGFDGVFTNIHPDLYQWLYTSGRHYPDIASELANFLALSALAEAYGYPVLAKLYHRRLGTFRSIHSRVISYDVGERYWAVEAIVEQLLQGTERMRLKVSQLPVPQDTGNRRISAEIPE